VLAECVADWQAGVWIFHEGGKRAGCDAAAHEGEAGVGGPFMISRVTVQLRAHATAWNDEEQRHVTVQHSSGDRNIACGCARKFVAALRAARGQGAAVAGRPRQAWCRTGCQNKDNANSQLLTVKKRSHVRRKLSMPKALSFSPFCSAATLRLRLLRCVHLHGAAAATLGRLPLRAMARDFMMAAIGLCCCCCGKAAVACRGWAEMAGARCCSAGGTRF
jgi:hypothetical protein